MYELLGFWAEAWFDAMLYVWDYITPVRWWAVLGLVLGTVTVVLSFINLLDQNNRRDTKLRVFLKALFAGTFVGGGWPVAFMAALILAQIGVLTYIVIWTVRTVRWAWIRRKTRADDAATPTAGMVNN